MATLTEVVTAIQTRLTGLTGVVFLPATPPENIADVQLPALLVYPASGSWGLGNVNVPPGKWVREGLHTIIVDLHIQRKNLGLDMVTAMPFADSIPQRLFQGFRNDRFDGTVWMLGQPNSPAVSYELMELRWGGMKTIGWRFSVEVQVKEQS